jgi:hypothetical protein
MGVTAFSTSLKTRSATLYYERNPSVTSHMCIHPEPWQWSILKVVSGGLKTCW